MYTKRELIKIENSHEPWRKKKIGESLEKGGKEENHAKVKKGGIKIKEKFTGQQIEKKLNSKKEKKKKTYSFWI